MKILPENVGSEEAFLDINCMNTKNNEEIYSCEIKIGQVDLTSQGKLDNIDSLDLIPKTYIDQIFSKMKKEKKEEAKHGIWQPKKQGYFVQPRPEPMPSTGGGYHPGNPF